MKHEKKPPLGLRPRKVWQKERDQVLSDRIKDIIQAMSRYFDADKDIPVTWFFELNEILGGVIDDK